MIAAVLAVAYGSSAPTLAVAEFAPAARQAVTAPPTTGAEAAAAASGRHRSTTTRPPMTAAPTTADASGGASAPPTTKVGRARQCFGNPPRQLPDPRSPACLATIFEGDNGGNTATGVTATEIRVAVPSSSAVEQGKMRSVFDYMNRYFEFYGRRLVPVFSNASAGSDVVGQRALATALAAQGVFAAAGTEGTIRLPAFYHELVRQHVVTVTSGEWNLLSDKDFMDPSHPFLWSVYPSLEDMWSNMADFVCTTLVGRPAAHGGPSVRDHTRKFGIISIGRERVPDTRILRQALNDCDAQPELFEVQVANLNTQFVAGVSKLRSAGVTSLICACWDQWGSGGFRDLAQRAGWSDPELLTPIFYIEGGQEWAVQVDRLTDQGDHLFGLQHFRKVMPPQAQRWLAAAQESGNQAITVNDAWTLSPLYEQLLVLGSGIQAAGPQLTPDTFGQGLMAAAFPNSEAGVAPEYLPSVGFGPGDHSFYDDYALAWWNNTAPAYGANLVSPVGSWCYLDRGARYSVGRFPKDADSRFFNPNEPCR